MTLPIAWMLLACGGATVEVPRPSETPSASEARVASPEPRPAPLRKDVCPEAFDPDGATLVYTKLSTLPTDCEFEGVATKQSRMELQWKQGNDIVHFEVTPASCAKKDALQVAETDGVLALLRPDEAMRTRCPESYAQLAKAVKAGGLVAPVRVGAPVLEPAPDH